jgi:hypothetical protein
VTQVICSGCGKRPGRPQPSGTVHYCRPCHAKLMREWRKANPLNEEQRRKDSARSYAYQYLKRGKLQRQPCQVCGAEKAQMHHHDYSKPLEVEWMCRPCHLQHHREEAA